MPPNADAQMPKLELNDQMVTDDDHTGLQPVIDLASRVAYEEQETSNFKLQMRLDSLEDALLKPTDDRVAVASSLYTANENSIKTAAVIAPAVASTIDAKAVEDDIKTFAESSKVLMKALDEISQIHPFIAVTVLAFKAVITLELKRRENDQKIVAIKLKMKDMMSALLELRNIKDPAQTAPDDTNIQGRMEGLMQQIATDIIACGNACDAYAKKNVIVKVLKSPIWEGRLADFITIFEQHRIAIIFSLSIHTSLGVDSANRTLSTVHQNVQSVDQKLNTLLLFRTLDSPHEKEIMKVVSTKGGPKACLDNDAILKELMTLSRGNVSPSPTASKGAKSDAADRLAFAKVKQETKEDVDDFLDKNMVHFERKLELQKRQIVKQIEDVVIREGDRVISALSGPHDRIIDSDLHAIWKEMGWRGSVKARHFVLALHDYFHEKYGETRNPNAIDHLRSPSPALSETVSDVADDLNPSLAFAFADNHTKRRAEDQWALAYINILRVQSVLEAFDDDATGFISIKEVNMFSSSRPANWTLTSWLAYWAAGWHYSVWDYKVKISMIVKTMFNTLDSVLPVNRNLVDRYIGSYYAFTRLELLVRSVRPYDAQDANDLERKVQPYIAEEEERLRSTLESVAWDIDTVDTVALITGPERIEKYLFPLLYLVLRRHMQIIGLACTQVLADFELDHASDALYYIFCAADDRIAKLSAILKSYNLDVSTQLGNVALGMFQFLHSPALAAKQDEDSEFVSDYSDDSLDQTDTSILKYGPQGDEFDRAAYEITDGEPITGLDVASAGLSIMKGIWSGPYFYSNMEKIDGLMQINVHTSSEDGSFDGKGADGLDTFTVSGHVKHTTEEDMEVRFVKDYTRLQFGEKISWIYHGNLDVATGTINGQWGDEESGDLGTFRLGQAPAWAHQFRYTSSELQENAARARWSFAIGSAIYEAKQLLWSWNFFKNRRTNRKRFLELFKRRELTNTWNFAQNFYLTEEEVKELQLLESSFTPADARFYHAIGRSEVRRLCVHFNAYCDACSSTIIDRRAACLICMFDDYSNQVDLCNSCINLAVRNRQFTHSPLHDMVQVRRVVQNRDKRSWITSAREAATRGKFAISRPKQLEGADVNVDPKWRCSCCDDPITMPCWFCFTCVTEIFICDACNTANVPCLKDGHTETHALVRLNNSVASENSTIESRLLSLENRFGEDQKTMSERLGRLEQRFETHESIMNDRFTALETKVDGRLVTVETLLSLIVSKLSS